MGQDPSQMRRVLGPSMGQEWVRQCLYGLLHYRKGGKIRVLWPTQEVEPASVNGSKYRYIIYNIYHNITVSGCICWMKEWLLNEQNSTFLKLISSILIHSLKFLGYENWAPEAHTCNPSYLGGGYQEEWSLKAAQVNSLWKPISKITRAKWMG
jgi:hypothetical protein